MRLSPIKMAAVFLRGVSFVHFTHRTLWMGINRSGKDTVDLDSSIQAFRTSFHERRSGDI